MAPKEVLWCILMDNDTKVIFSNVWITFRIVLAILVTVEYEEHSFSKVKQINTYLRSTMGDERLSIKNDIAVNLDWTILVNKFADIKVRKDPLKL